MHVNLWAFKYSFKHFWGDGIWYFKYQIPNTFCIFNCNVIIMTKHNK